MNPENTARAKNKAFAVRIVKLCQFLREDKKEYTFPSKY